MCRGWRDILYTWNKECGLFNNSKGVDKMYRISTLVSLTLECGVVSWWGVSQCSVLLPTKMVVVGL
jgi:hypothetical protein